MAKTKKASQNNTTNDLFENPDALAEQLSKTEEFLEKNKNLVFTIGGILGFAVLAFLGYNYYTSSQNDTAQRELFQAVYYYEADSLGKALNGDGNSYGFLEIIDEYGITEAGNLANFYAGATYLKMGDFESAVRYLESFGSGDYLIQGRAYALIGDAHAELGNLEEAIGAYERAISYYENDEFTPIYLIKVAISYEANGQLEDALASYKQIMDTYPNSPEAREAIKQHARLNGLI